jgi:hypothetical protein
LVVYPIDTSPDILHCLFTSRVRAIGIICLTGATKIGVSEKFPIIEVSPEDAQEPESLGTKEKFWFRHDRLGLCLYKKSRSNTAGEDWSEKIAAELCGLIKLPHAKYELATCNGEYGIISRSFLPKNGNLILGNEILARIYPDYPKDTRDLSEHTLSRIFGAFDRLETEDSEIFLPLGWEPPGDIIKAQHTFIGYLLLDAWIGNSDRHHENWGFIELERKLYLAPTYDHASSLGRNESDLKRSARLRTQDRGYSVGSYADKCQSYFYANIGRKQRIKTFEAFCEVAKLYPQVANTWIEYLQTISSDDLLRLFERLPDERISPIASEFARSILIHNRDRLLQFRNQL